MPRVEGKQREAFLDTQFGPIKVEHKEGWGYSGEGTIWISKGDYQIEIRSPGRKHAVDEAWANVRSVNVESWEEAADLAALVAYAGHIVGLYNDAIGDLVAAREAEEAEEERKQEEREAEERKATREREEQLLQELVGERVKIRHRGYKSTTEAIIGAIERGDEWYVQLEPYGNHEGMYSRGRRNVEAWRRVDVKTDKGWKTVWDDGKDDLPEYDRGKDAPQYQPYK